MDKLSLCNSALTRCGAEPIATLIDTSLRATVTVNQYDTTLKEVLTDSPWNFAIKRVTLTVDATPPLFGFNFRYVLPADAIRILELDNKIEYRVEGGFILCDQDVSINIKYIFYNQDPTTYGGAFVKAFYLKLAEDISYKIVQSAALQGAISQEAERYLRKARSMNSQEGTPERRYSDDYAFGIRQ